MLKTLIIADDLTGAADCALACGPGTLVVLEDVLLQDSGELGAEEAVAIDAHTRSMDAERAAFETARMVRAHPAALVYKKIDSTMRGHVRVEVEAALSAYREMGHAQAVAVVAPAFPAMGRITRGGRQYVHGVAIDAPELPELCDAETDEDLRSLVAAWRGREVVWAGSAGLMYALMADVAKQETLALPKVIGPIVFAVGSNAERSREQVATLSEALRGTADAVILTGEPQALAGRVSKIERIGALVLTGGDTARAVLLVLGITALRIAGEVEPGVPLMLTDGAFPVITKSGSFGDRETLLRIFGFLRQLRLRQTAADDERDRGQAQPQQ